MEKYHRRNIKRCKTDVVHKNHCFLDKIPSVSDYHLRTTDQHRQYYRYLNRVQKKTQNNLFITDFLNWVFEKTNLYLKNWQKTEHNLK